MLSTDVKALKDQVAAGLHIGPHDAAKLLAEVLRLQRAERELQEKLERQERWVAKLFTKLETLHKAAHDLLWRTYTCACAGPLYDTNYGKQADTALREIDNTLNHRKQFLRSRKGPK